MPRKTSNPVICLETGTMYQSMQSAVEDLTKKGKASSLVRVLNSLYKTYRGYHWVTADSGISLSLIEEHEEKMRNEIVICLETGTWFTGRRSAAQSIGVKLEKLNDVLAGKGDIDGYHWRNN